MSAAGVLAGVLAAAALRMIAGRWTVGGRLGVVACWGVPVGARPSPAEAGADRGSGVPIPSRGGSWSRRARGAAGGFGALGRWSASAGGVAGRGGSRGAAGAGLVIDVATTVRAGVPPDLAWTTAGIRCGATGVPERAVLTGAGLEASDARAVVAGCRLALELGAPLAPVLEGIAELIDEQAELAGERAAAAAGPRSSIRVMTGLPLVCVGVGAAMGADPLRVLLDDGPGRVAFAVGAALLWGGRRWARALVRSAERAGQS